MCLWKIAATTTATPATAAAATKRVRNKATETASHVDVLLHRSTESNEY